MNLSVFGEIKMIKTKEQVFTDAHWGQLEMYASQLLRQTARPFVNCFLTNGTVIQFARIKLIDIGLTSESIEVSPSTVEFLCSSNSKQPAKGLKQLLHLLMRERSDLGMLPEIFHPSGEQLLFTRRLGSGSTASVIEVKTTCDDRYYTLLFGKTKSLLPKFAN